MKQRDFLFAGLLLLAAPAFAQDGPTFDPTKDAKVVFVQDFESDWKTWSTTPVDSITKVQYWDQQGNSNSASLKPWDDGWKKVSKLRDTTMILYNGVVVVDEDEKWAEDDATAGTIIRDSGAEKIDRNATMAKYGEADQGGKYYFKFTTDTAPTKFGQSAYSNGLAARYRRNLFVRGLNVEENSSYRLTFYVKGNVRKNAIPANLNAADINLTLYADVMRGYFHNEKPFSMGYINDSKTYQYTNSFAYTKDFFNGDWEKVTFMTYYTTDSIADYYVFVDGYWWADGAWTWQSKDTVGSTNPKKYDLNYIVQPDKYFVRLGFASNYSEFCIDNMSLTKSWIGGVEYYQDMLRVNFGYETNLKDLAREAYEKTRVDAVEVPGKYFEVWGKYPDGTWELTDIASAEYQGDGYMYMFTDTYIDGNGEEKHLSFEDYDTVLVTFTNPAEKEIQLKYTGDLFPRANDVEWIKAGKLVPNFYNEVAQLNPYAFQGVYSMSNRPPVCQSEQYEDGSFGLDGTIRQLKFQFSSEMEIDNPANVETRKKCVVYVGEEIWDRAWDKNTKTLTLTRPAKYTTPLKGDVEVEINNLYMPNTDRKGDDVIMHYNFGEINRDLSTVSFSDAVWDAKFYDETVNPNDAGTATKPLSPNGTAIWWNKESGWSRQRTFQVLDGTTELNAARLYRYADSTLTNLRALAICPRNDASVPAKFYLGYSAGFDINLTAGNYVLKYKAQPINKLFGFKVYVYPWVEDPRTVGDGDKLLVAEHNNFDRYFVEALMKNADNNVDTILINEFNDGFQVAKGGKYLIEIHVNPASNGDTGYPSMLFSNFELFNSPVSFGPIAELNNAVAAAQKKAAEVTDAKYAGAALTALNTLIEKYKVDGTFTSQKPSDWKAGTKSLNDAVGTMQLRKDTVDLLVKKAEDVAKKLTDVAVDNANWANLIDYKALQTSKTTFDSYPYSSKSNADITAFIKTMDDQMKALDKRVKDTKQFNVELAKAKKLIDAKELTSIKEYGDLKDVYDDKSGIDTIAVTDEVLTAALNLVAEAATAYGYGVGIYSIGTRGIKALDALATKLNTGIKDSAVVKERFDALATDDDYLAAIYKAAIKAAIYENAASITEEDLTPFIKNYYLYATPIIENPDGNDENGSKVKDSGYGTKAISNAKHNKAGSNVYVFEHAWNSNRVYCLYKDGAYDNVFPGWSVDHNGGSGNQYVAPDSIGKQTNLKDEVPVYDGAISLDWGSQVYLTQYVIGLPAGEYELGVDAWNTHNASEMNNSGELTLKVRAGGRDDKEVSTKFDFGYISPKEFYVPNDTVPGKIDTIPNTANCDSTAFRTIKFTLPESVNEAIKITAQAKTGNGNGQLDNFQLKFKPLASYSDSLIAAAKADVARVITVVDFTKAQKAANVEFYTLSGLKVDGIKPGQILIRKTTNANGKVAVDKVLLK